jgi:hypothetical protein
MTLVVKETVAGVLIMSTTGRRTQVRNRIEAYLGRPRVNVIPSSPLLIDDNTNKYGVGFALIARAEFVSRADADAVWADITSNSLAILEPGSFIDQYTSNEDQEVGLDETIYIHRLHVPAAPGDF